MPRGEKEFNSTSWFKGGAAFEFIELTESDFILPAEPAYVPPEIGVARRINISRAIQLLKTAPSVITTTQTSQAILRLPCGLSVTNDALDGRIFYFRNSGSGNIILQDHLGNLIATILSGVRVIIVHKEEDGWEVFYSAGTDPIGNDIDTLGFGEQGTITNEFLEVFDNMPSNETPEPVGIYDVILRGWSYRNTNNTTGFRVRFYKVPHTGKFNQTATLIYDSNLYAHNGSGYGGNRDIEDLNIIVSKDYGLAVRVNSLNGVKPSNLKIKIIIRRY